MDFSTATLFVSFLIFSATSAIEDQREIKAKSGENVTLQCRSPRDEAITLLEWSRPDLLDSYVFLYRNERSYENYQHPTVRGRVQLRDPEMKDGDVSVTLKNVTINDTGTYKCHVIISNTEGRDVETKHIIQLKVTSAEGDKDGGDKNGGDKDEENKDGYTGMVVGLSVTGVVLLLLLLGIFSFKYITKHNKAMMTSHQRPPERENVPLQA